MARARGAAPLALLAAAAAARGGATPPRHVVSWGSEPFAAQLAVQVCIGLYNRDEAAAGSAYGMAHSSDSFWLEAVDGVSDPPLTAVPDFLRECVRTSSAGYIRYNATSQQALVPNIVTLAGVLGAVPLEDGDPAAAGATMTFDALTAFAGMDPRDCTEYMHTHYVNQTTGMSKMNPGIRYSGIMSELTANPPLVAMPDIGLADFVVKERLFNFYLNTGCIPLTKEHALVTKIAADNPWPRPIRVYGYDSTFPLFGGDVFEAETGCAKEHNMGQIASAGVNNLAYWSRKPAIASPVRANPDPPFVYNASKTYVAFAIGDGDNVAFVKDSRRDWMSERVADCAADPKACYPLLWTLSPHLLHLAPDWLRWFYNQSYATGRDYFILPPSGDLYAYPGKMSAADQAAFVANTERDCELMSTSAAVPWETAGTWEKAISDYFPRYAARGVVRGLFPVNVPYILPVLAFSRGEQFKVFGGKTVLFAPREWRGTDHGRCEVNAGGKLIGGVTEALSRPFCLNATEMAAEINGFAPGHVSGIYITSDGGFHYRSLSEMVALLGEHVEVVNHNALVDAALQQKAGTRAGATPRGGADAALRAALPAAALRAGAGAALRAMEDALAGAAARRG